MANSFLNPEVRALHSFLDAHEDVLEFPSAQTLMINPQYEAFFDGQIPGASVLTYDFSTFEIFSAKGFSCHASFEDLKDKSFGHILVFMSKNITETQYHLARALKLLRPAGHFVFIGRNDLGSERLRTLTKKFGLSFSVFSKQKCKIIFGRKAESFHKSLQEKWQEKRIKEGQKQIVKKTGFISKPGIFGWDKIDQGSKLLLENLPDGLYGTGADFGCGYGFLSAGILEKNKDVKELYSIDSDKRSVQCCAENLAQLEHKAHSKCLWKDLREKPDIPALDFIVMNPPFHEGKSTQASLGQRLIETAASALKKGGALYMVSNNHLPYEKTLQDFYYSYAILQQKEGFKIFKAIK